jgi:cytoskeleton protein RodZ
MPDIGSTLREARMRERIDISEVEAHTKIRAKYLRAIENEEWDLLPGPVYAKSFLRTYGDYLGLDSRMLVDEFRRRYEGQPDHEIRPIAARSPRERDRRPPRRIPSWVSVLVAVVLILVALAAIGIFSKNHPGSTTAASSGQASGGHRTRHRRAAVATQPVTPPPPRTVTLHLVPTGPVYVCLVRGDGTRLIYEQTYAAGETIPTETGYRLLLTLGNNNVQMTVNGKPIPVPASPTAIRLMITPPNTVTPISPTQTPTCP